SASGSGDAAEARAAWAGGARGGAGGAGAAAAAPRRVGPAQPADGRVRRVRRGERRAGLYAAAARAPPGAHRVGAGDSRRVRSPGPAPLGAGGEAWSHPAERARDDRLGLSWRADDPDDQPGQGAGASGAGHAYRAARVSAGGGGGARGGGEAAAERAW